MIIGSLQIDRRRDSVLWGIDKGANMLVLVGNIALASGWEKCHPGLTPALTVFKAQSESSP